MGKNNVEKIKNSAYYKEVAKIHREYYDVFSPLGIALFGDLGKDEYTLLHLPFGSNIKEGEGREDTTRSGLIYGIATLLAQGMSIDDILDPKKELDKKRAAGNYFMELNDKKDKKAILEIYEKATEYAMNELDFEVKDNLLDNTRDIKNMVLRKLIFDLNQRFGLYKEQYKSLLQERYKDQPNADELAKERFTKIYSATEYVHVVQSLELTPFKILSEDKNLRDMVIGHMTTYDVWNKVKNNAKKLNKESPADVREDLRVEKEFNFAMSTAKVVGVDIDIEAFFAENIKGEKSLVDSVENVQKENKYKKIADKLSGIPEFGTMMDIQYNYNQLSNEMVKSFYGDDAAKYVVRGENFDFMSTGMQDEGVFHLKQSGATYVAAILYAEGMSLADILDPEKDVDIKRKAGLRVQEMASLGDEGRRKMALLAAEAMQRLENEKFENVSLNMMKNTADYKMHFASKMMADLKRETEQALNLKEAYEYHFKQENPQLSANEAEKKAQDAFNRTQSYYAEYKPLVEFQEANKDRMFDHFKMAEALGVSTEVDHIGGTEIDFQKKCFEKMYEDLLAVDPKLLRSSPEFKGMRQMAEEIINLYQDVKKMDKNDFYRELDAKCTKLVDFNEKYLDKKKGIKPKEGSNAKKRLNFASGIKTFVKEAKSMAANSYKMYKALDTHMMKVKINQNKIDIQNAENRCIELASPSIEKKDFSYSDTAVSFMDKCLSVKKEENNFVVPKSLNLTKEQASLLVMLSVGTAEVSKINEIVPSECKPADKADITVSVLVEDIYNMRDGFEDEKMTCVERGRWAVKHAFEAYEKGNKSELANILAEGLKHYTNTFSQFHYGLTSESGQETKIVTACKVAGEIYDMLAQNENLKKMLMEDPTGEYKITKELLEEYCGTKATYNVYQKAEQAKLDLLKMDFQQQKTTEQQQVMKEALATIVFKNILHKEFLKHEEVEKKKNADYIFKKYNTDNVLDLPDELFAEYEAESMTLQAKCPVSKVQRELTEKKTKLCIEKLANSKTIEHMVNSLDSDKLITMFKKEEVFFEKVIENIVKKEPELLKAQEKEMKAEKTNQKVNEDVQLNLN